MRKRIKCYLVFTSFVYRIIMYCLLPLILFGTAFAAGYHKGRTALIVITGILPQAEVIMDNWLFGGLHTKDTEKLDYLKTSGRGTAAIRNALYVDLFRKLLTAMIALTITYLAVLRRNIGQTDENLTQMWIFAIALSWFCSVLGTFISRYGSILWFNVLIGYMMSVLESICWILMASSKCWPAYIFLLAVLGIGASMMTVKIAMKKVEGSYYDQ